jgi:hypothetical protein
VHPVPAAACERGHAVSSAIPDADRGQECSQAPDNLSLSRSSAIVEAADPEPPRPTGPRSGEIIPSMTLGCSRWPPPSTNCRPRPCRACSPSARRSTVSPQPNATAAAAPTPGSGMQRYSQWRQEPTVGSDLYRCATAPAMFSPAAVVHQMTLRPLGPSAGSVPTTPCCAVSTRTAENSRAHSAHIDSDETRADFLENSALVADVRRRLNGAVLTPKPTHRYRCKPRADRCCTASPQVRAAQLPSTAIGCTAACQTPVLRPCSGGTRFAGALDSAIYRRSADGELFG